MSGQVNNLSNAEKYKRILTINIWIVISVLYLLVCRTTDIRVPCIFHELTGMDCPGCGTTRMVMHISELDFRAAFHDNPLVFTTSPTILYLVGCELYRYTGHEMPGRIERANRVIAAVLAIMLILFGLYRIFVAS